jgi:hypothetical protein
MSRVFDVIMIRVIQEEGMMVEVYTDIYLYNHIINGNS